MSINYPIVNEGLKYINGLGISYATATTLTVASGQARDSTNVNDINLSASVTINGAINGAGGLDQGSLANNTWYAVFAIDDSTKANTGSALISTSATAPILPFNYNMVARIGWVRTDGSSQFLPFHQTGNSTTRRMCYDTLIQVLSAGNATTFTDVDCSASVPTTAKGVLLRTAFTPATAGTNRLKIRVNGSSSVNGSAQVNGTVNSVISIGEVWSPIASGVIEYLVTNASDAADISIVAYDDEL